MLYPKCFEKQALDVGVLAERLVQPVVSTVRRAIKLNTIANHKAPEMVPAVISDTQQDPSIVQQGAYVDNAGVIYPSVFGYQVPAELIPRKIKPILRNIPTGGLS